ncbi:MAG: SDR family oxidoreductase [Limnochordia bacterium]|jgi:NADP-dependent 3-hydroxy acid dehydrogenase YdfG
MRDLQGKVVVVPGASGGVGQAVCKYLANEGCKLVIGSNQPDMLQELVAALEADNATFVSQELDVTDEQQVAAFLKLAMDSFGQVDILLNLPGLSITGPIAEMDLANYRKIMDVNLMGSFLCAKHFVAMAKDGGQIINIGSMAAKRANPNAPMYCTAKAAVNMFSDGLALQVKEKDIRVTVLNPGPIDSTFWGDRQVPREKFMKPADVAEVILFILKMDERIVFHEVNFESFLFIKG